MFEILKADEKIAELRRERDAARQEAADLRAALTPVQKALAVALHMLFPHEPPHSAGVSDEFVAMASLDNGDYSPEVLAVINKAFEESRREASAVPV